MSLRQPPGMTKRSPFRYSKTLPEIIRLAVMLYIRFPLSLRNVEDLLHERGIEISDKTVRFWWNRFGPFPPETGMRQGAPTAGAENRPSVQPCLRWRIARGLEGRP